MRAFTNGKREFLYVTRNEIVEAEALGAVRVAGDARMLKPRPLPFGVGDGDFERWRTVGARYRWCLEMLREHLGDVLRVDPGCDTVIKNAAGAESAGERVYLYARTADAERLRAEPGVVWDRKRRMYYATRQADLNRLFGFLTPEARSVVDAERSTSRSLDALVAECARAEYGGAGTEGGDDPDAAASRVDAAVRSDGGAER